MCLGGCTVLCGFEVLTIPCIMLVLMFAVALLGQGYEELCCKMLMKMMMVIVRYCWFTVVDQHNSLACKHVPTFIR